MKFKNLILISLLLIISWNMLIRSKEIIESVLFAFEIWKNNVFPTIFPFFIISSLLISYGFVDIVKEVFKPLMMLFGINENASFIFVLSMLTGFPSSAKYTKDLYENNKIDIDTSNKILMFSHFSNPLFIISTITSLLNKKYAYIILFSHYISNFIIGILFRGYKNTYTKTKINFKNINIQSNNIGINLKNAIKDAIDTLLLILGTITTFSFFCIIINTSFNFNDILSAIINGLFEITSGIKYVSLLNISLNYKAVLISSMLSFGGLAIHAQVYSIISDIEIKYLPYLFARIIHAFIAGILTYIITLFI